jgi:cobalt/nickel transport protein
MKSTRWIWIGLATALAVGALLSLAASPAPDGLERVAEDKGFLEQAAGTPLLRSPLPNYVFPGIADERLATGLAGFLGTLALFAVGYVVGWALRSGRRRGA